MEWSVDEGSNGEYEAAHKDKEKRKGNKTDVTLL